MFWLFSCWCCVFVSSSSLPSFSSALIEAVVAAVIATAVDVLVLTAADFLEQLHLLL